MADFETAFRKTIEMEGGWVDDPVDPGGETYKGITRRDYAGWAGWSIVDRHKAEPGFRVSLELNEELQSLVRTVYRTEFWDRLMLDRIEITDVAAEIFDTAVNAGRSTAVRLAQRAANALGAELSVDGFIGPKTIAALNAAAVHDLKALVVTLNALQCARYVELTERNPALKRFFRGWVNHRVQLRPV